MFNKIISLGIFAKLFTFGLLLLFFDVFKEFVFSAEQANYFLLRLIPFFEIGITICLISLLFLLIDWLSLPFGTQAKRVKFYQGAGNMFALAMLSTGVFIKSSPSNFAGKAALFLSFGGLIVAVAFGWLGKPIADLLSRKKIKVEIPMIENAGKNAEPPEALAANETKPYNNSISSKISGSSITQH